MGSRIPYMISQMVLVPKLERQVKGLCDFLGPEQSMPKGLLSSPHGFDVRVGTYLHAKCLSSNHIPLGLND